MKLLISMIIFLLSNNTFALVKVKMETTKGDIILELNDEKAPVSVKNFLKYTDSGFYNGLIFHRVISGFMIQGGGFSPTLQKKNTESPIKNEANNGLRNDIGTIAMARTSDINSATSQFYINVNDNNSLNYKSDNPREYGYAVFGRVIKGMTVINKIKKVSTTVKGVHRNVPVENIIIKKVSRL